MSIDNNVDQLCQEFQTRAAHGLTKYGVTTERTDLTPLEWIQHLKEELMDACVYIQAIQNHIKKELK